MRKMPNPGVEIMWGRLVPEGVRCGRSPCRCERGERHGPYWYLRWRDSTGRQRRAYVPRDRLRTIRFTREVWRALMGETPTAARREQRLLRRVLRDVPLPFVPARRPYSRSFGASRGRWDASRRGVGRV